jgi:hypothetical protein
MPNWPYGSKNRLPLAENLGKVGYFLLRPTISMGYLLLWATPLSARISLNLNNFTILNMAL